MFKGYTILKSIGVMSDIKGFTKEVNLIQYEGLDRPVIDIRKWDRTPLARQGMMKGITLTKDEAKALYEALSKVDFDKL